MIGTTSSGKLIVLFGMYTCYVRINPYQRRTKSRPPRRRAQTHQCAQAAATSSMRPVRNSAGAERAKQHSFDTTPTAKPTGGPLQVSERTLSSPLGSDRSVAASGSSTTCRSASAMTPRPRTYGPPSIGSLLSMIGSTSAKKRWSQVRRLHSRVARQVDLPGPANRRGCGAVHRRAAHRSGVGLTGRG